MMMIQALVLPVVVVVVVACSVFIQVLFAWVLSQDERKICLLVVC
jgi:hypothetical protein